jgi:hypothetical protein
LEFPILHRYAPDSQKSPWKELVACNVALGGEGRRGSPEFGGSGDTLGWESGGRGCGAHQGSLCGLRRRRGGSGGLGQQAQGGFGRGGFGSGGFLTGELGGKARRLPTRKSVLTCGEGLGRFVRLGEHTEGELTAGVPMVVRRLRRPALVWTHEGHVSRYIARGLQGGDSALVEGVPRL